MTFRLAFAIAMAMMFPITGGRAGETGCGPASIPVLDQGLPGAPTVEIFGTLTAIDGLDLTLRTRDGKTVRIDARAVAGSERVTPINRGLPVVVLATTGPRGVLLAQAIGRAKPLPIAWGPDCYDEQPSEKR